MIRYLVVGLGGFVGANARYIVATWVGQRWSGLPYGTFVINISGCFILGMFQTLALRLAWDDNWRLLIAMGFVGAYTTFSTFEYETLMLATADGWKWAFANIVGSVVVGFGAAYLGVVTARLLLRGR